VVGSAGYFKAHGRPEKPDDLRDHACLRIRRSSGAVAPWNFIDGNKALEAIVAGPLIAHDYPTLIGAAQQGLGLVQVPEPLAASAIRHGKLETILGGFSPTTPGVFLYYLDRRQVLPKLRAFIDFVKGSS